MFTGIVEEMGEVLATSELGAGREIRIAASLVLEGLALGDSISLDGACHTVVEIFHAGFVVQSVATTLSRTTVGSFRQGRRVNLERAMALGQRLGGHLVQGHVDATGSVRSIVPREELVLIDIEVPPDVGDVTVLHGSIAVNGVSLTVNAIPQPDVVQVSIIPFTWKATNFPDLREGDAVNLEGDMIGKYVRRLLGAPATGGAASAGAAAEDLRRSWGY